MKFSSILAIALCVAVVSAAPRGGNRYNREDNSKNANKSIHQSIGSVGSTGKTGLLSGVLAGGVLAKNTNSNTVNQQANIS
ncbi:uncharacterized protein BX663DRAFT_498766 [Cokeromyces recurvatus]|uniref:uncharacterized protein n=1 Tax=Cokeromyces recurvatus TaxID=90255 RepID=UPI00221F115C|nr:uncharacterized protein BX663DRAFT_498766 [Cokeromyces recurvatus]KAI7906097.1 hypothetical protein BX663DRAFT_498766 [Cokeromyces recurvatus]